MSLNNIFSSINDYIQNVKINLKNNGVSEEIIDKSFNAENVNPKSKYAKDHDKVILISDYSPKSQALFGISEQHKTFKNKYLSNNGIFNNRLKYGKGWCFKINENVSKELKKYDIEFQTFNKEEYEKLLDSETVKEEHEGYEERDEYEEHEEYEERDENEEHVVYDFLSNSETPNTPEDKVPDKSTVKKNKWGNLEDENGYIFKKLPIGKKGEMGVVVIGKQNHDYIAKLTEKQSELCKDNNMRSLSKLLLIRIKKNWKDNEQHSETLSSLISISEQE